MRPNWEMDRFWLVNVERKGIICNHLAQTLTALICVFLRLFFAINHLLNLTDVNFIARFILP